MAHQLAITEQKMDDESSALQRVLVAIRIRPLLIEGREDALDADADVGKIYIPSSKKEFTFDQVVPHTAEDSQHVLFSKHIQPLVECTLSGYNATVLAYGQTGSGKTHTMMGGIDASKMLDAAAQRQWGVIPRITHDMFEQVNGMQGDGTKVIVQVSFLEIYVSYLFYK
jgi:hypothetical protein